MPLMKAAVALAALTLLSGCLFEEHENRCVGTGAGPTPNIRTVLTNDCSYTIVVRYCRQPERGGRERCSMSTVEPGGTVARVFQNQSSNFRYGACRAPQRPFVEGGRFECK